jgi:hypothetical protein
MKTSMLRKSVVFAACCVFSIAGCGDDDGPTHGHDADVGPETSVPSDTGVDPDTGAVADCETHADCTDPELPVCDDAEGTCRGCDIDSECADRSASAPVCDPSGACRACNEHHECPDSACHLDGPDQGACFDVTPVQVTDSNGLAEALDDLSDGDQVVVWLAGETTYDVALTIAAAAEVAIIGTDTDVVLDGDGENIIHAGNGAIVYVANATLTNGLRGGYCSHGDMPEPATTCHAMWFDDAHIVGNSTRGVSGHGKDHGHKGAFHLRRSRVADTGQAGIRIVDDGEVHLDRTEVHGNGHADSGTRGGIRINGGILTMRNSAVTNNTNASGGGIWMANDVTAEITYSTIAHNPGSVNDVYCSGDEDPTGSIRNSILFTFDTDPIDTCSGITFENNALDTDVTELGETNVEVEPELAWFEVGLPRLTAAGAEALDGIAQWQAGDPLTDVDGNPIPTDDPSYPGLHQYQE